MLLTEKNLTAFCATITAATLTGAPGTAFVAHSDFKRQVYP